MSSIISILINNNVKIQSRIKNHIKYLSQDDEFRRDGSYRSVVSKTNNLNEK